MDIYKKKVWEKVRRYISRWFRTEEDAEDIVQEAFLKVLEAGAKGEIYCSEAYLYRTAHNLALNKLCSKSTTAVDFIEDLLHPDVNNQSRVLDEQIVAQERFELFCRSVSRLPEQCREVLILRKVYGYSQKEVAKTLGISISTVEKHVAKGLLRCREYMSLQDKPTVGDEDIRNQV